MGGSGTGTPITPSVIVSQGSYQYYNCYAMLEEIRTELNEYTIALCQGTEKGVFDNSDIVRKINQGQKFIYNMLLPRFPDLFLTSTILTGVSGVYTLPSNLYKLSHVDTGKGFKVYNINVKTKHLETITGSNYLYYRQNNTVVRDSGNCDPLTVYYYKTMTELTQGVSSAGTTNAITLASTAKPIADYYKNIIIENITDGWADIITAYSSGRVATITQTGSAAKYYGTVSELPDVFQPFIAKKATIELKASVVSPQKPDPTEVSNLREELIETLRVFSGSAEDVSLDELLYSFDPYL